MDPLTIAAGAMVVGAAVQYYNAEKARGASKEQLKKIERMYNEIKPPDYDLSITAPPELHEQTLALPKFSDPMQAPQFNLDKLTSEQFKMVGKFAPEIAPYVAEAAPQLIEKTADMKLGRDAQLKALKRFTDIGEGEFDPAYQEAVTKASRQAGADAQSRQESIMQDFARRGQAGSGMNLIAQLQGAADSADRQAMSNLSAATQSYQNQLNALAQGASLGSQISSEDMSMQQRNADAINAFNQRTAANQQNWQNQRANTLNNAQQYNLGVQQGLANMNTSAANDAARYNQGRMDDITRYNTSFAQSERDRQDALAKYLYDAQNQQTAYNNALAMDKYNIANQGKQQKNSLLNQGFQNQMQITGGKSGVAQQGINQIMQGAADQNQAIGGLSQAAMIYGMGQQGRADQRANAMAQADNAQYNRTGSYMTPDEQAAYKKRWDEYGAY